MKSFQRILVISYVQIACVAGGVVRAGSNVQLPPPHSSRSFATLHHQRRREGEGLWITKWNAPASPRPQPPYSSLPRGHFYMTLHLMEKSSCIFETTGLLGKVISHFKDNTTFIEMKIVILTPKNYLEMVEWGKRPK